jgi:hypothetical protein
MRLLAYNYIGQFKLFPFPEVIEKLQVPFNPQCKLRQCHSIPLNWRLMIRVYYRARAERIHGSPNERTNLVGIRSKRR